MSGAAEQQQAHGKEDMERMIFFEQAKEQAEADVKKDPNDAQALTRWGGALLELAHLRQGPEAYEYIEQAVQKFEEALKINPRKHDALWCLGNALTSQGFLYAEAERAQQFFNRAKDCFEKALAEDPKNDVYRKSLEMTERAPSLHAELQQQLQEQSQQQAARGGASGSSASTVTIQSGGASRGSERGSRASEQADPRVDFWYDVAGWGVLSLIIAGCAMLARGGASASASR